MLYIQGAGLCFQKVSPKPSVHWQSGEEYGKMQITRFRKKQPWERRKRGYYGCTCDSFL